MDSVLVFPPGASQLASAWASTIQLGSWLMADPGPDYGAKGLIESVEAQNALRDGGTFAYRRGVIRKMALPLMLNTASPAMWETALRKAVTPGAIVAVQPAGVPSAQAVYFDIIDGRWEPDYNIFHNRVGVRKGTLYLDTQPWGYWPTEILLASTASMSNFGQLAVNGASVIGDVPPLARVQVAPTTASVYTGSAGNQSWWTDMVALSFGGGPSFAPLITARMLASTGFFGLGSLIGDKYAPGSQAIQIPNSQGQGAGVWNGAYYYMVPSALEPSFRGRFRAFLFARISPSGFPWQTIMGADSWDTLQALPSANQIATVTAIGGSVSPSPGYQTLDMGEIQLPARGSGIQQNNALTFWYLAPSQAASSNLIVGGMYLLPVEGAGILTRGLAPASIISGQPGYLELNRRFVDSVDIYLAVSSPIASGWQAGAGAPVSDGRAFYRGVMPRLGASMNSLALLTADRSQSGATTLAAQMGVEYAQVSVSYRPTFQFLAGG